ncbi:MAG: SWIM zinc finger family protein [Microcoleaceae cyanobacterium]
MTETLPTDREWWSQQWLDILNRYRFKKRLERARNYARQGNVLSIEFKDQKVNAQVQGTQPEPYQVSLGLDTFNDEEWHYVIETLSQKALFSAKLLAGEMPDNIEEVFARNGLRLFPFSLEEVHSRCSCPDKANPCKHIGAVYYMLGDRFSEDPFVLFQLRGRTKTQILAELRQLRSQGKAEETQLQSIKKESVSTISQSEIKIDRFWDYSEKLESSLVVIVPPPTQETVLDILGTIPLSSSSITRETVMQYLETVYKNVSQQAVITALNREES